MNKYVLIFIAIVIVLLAIAVPTYFFPYDSNVSSSLQAIGVCGALLISIIALIYAVMEYRQHKKAAETTLICQYIQRYANDKNTQVMEKYILEAALIDEKTGQIIGFNKNAKVSYTPSIYEKEMYMHIFEELQLCIEAKMIPHSVALNLFGYYLSVFHQIEEFHSDITDYNNRNYFEYYLKFAESIPPKFYLK